MTTQLETDIALVYSTCAKVLLDSQICRGGKASVYRAVCELTHGSMTDISTIKKVTEGQLLVWGVFYFEREFEEINHDCWRRTMIIVKREVREFAMAGSLVELMHLVAAYCRTEDERRTIKAKG